MRLTLARCLPVAVFLAASGGCPGRGVFVARDASVTDAEVGLGADVVDAVDVDALPLPPGPRGQILGVPLTRAESWTVPALRSPVQVIRTEAGVPHIYAANERDAHVVWGFVTARDRYTQIELARRLGQGIISSLLGDRGLTADQGARDRGYAVVADRIIGQLTPEELDLFDAYAEGVNACVDAVRAQRLPVPTEIGPVGLLLGHLHGADLMQHLSRRDLAAVLAVVLFNASFVDDDLNRARVATTLATLAHGLPDEALRREGVLHDLFERVAPITGVTSASGFGLEGGPLMARGRVDRGGMRSSRRADPRSPRVQRDVLARAMASSSLFNRLRRGSRDADFGSNAWATMGRASARGAAILSGDGHLPLSVPTLLAQVGIDTSIFGDPVATDSVHFLGLAFPGIPALPLGTNGDVAYSFTYLYGDLTDWYAEEIQLDAGGRPTASRFRMAWRPLVATQERYEIANVPSLNSVGRTETWTRWATFDGRMLASIEGHPATSATVPGPGESLVEIQGVLVVPADVDGDGIISGVSFDYTGFDVSDVVMGLRRFSRAHNVEEIHAAQQRFVGFAQNFVAADRHGNVYYSGYTGTPCREYLPRPGGAWSAGADPRLLLDGTQYAGFTIPLDASGMPDETAGRSDPQRCVIPNAQWPTAINPTRGYVLTANNDLGGTSIDNNLANDAYYLGGPWDVGYRARTIGTTLAAHVAARTSSVDTMASLQASHRSNFADEFLPFLFEAVVRAQELAAAGGTPGDPADARLLALYQSERAAIDDAQTRLDRWRTRGANAASGVTTFYDSPGDDDRADAAATMVFNAWYRRLDRDLFDDENIADVLALDPRAMRTTTLLGMIQGRGAGNPLHLASWNPVTRESVFFDDTRTPFIESSREVALGALVRSLRSLRAAPSAPGVGGFGTPDMSQYLWGLRHLVAFPSLIDAYASGVTGVEFITNQLKISPSRLPLAPGLLPDDPRANLPWFPRPGDYYAVDAANPSSVGDDYFYRSGPVMRMVIELDGGRVHGQNVIPGGQSGLATSPDFDDQARLWLGNRALPMRFDVDAVVAGAIGREEYHP